MMATVSIIMPVYNTEAFLERVLDSLCGQTFQDIEIICIDDGSSDNGGAILDRYAVRDPKVKVFHQPNSGPAAARNLGLEKAGGKYLMFCDSDDWYEPEMVAEMVKAIEENDVDLAACDAEIIEEDQDHYRSESDITYNHLNITGKLELTDEVKAKINVVLWNKILKKEIVDRFQIRFPTGYEHDDTAFIILYLEAAKTIFGLQKRLYNYVLRGNSIMAKLMSKKNFNKKFDLIYSLAFILKNLQKNQLMTHKSYIFKFIEQQLIWGLRLLEPIELKQAFSLCRKEITDRLSGEFPTGYEVLDHLQQNKKAWLNRKFSVTPHTKRLKVLGINLAKIKYDTFYTKYYLFGMRLWKQNFKETESPEPNG